MADTSGGNSAGAGGVGRAAVIRTGAVIVLFAALSLGAADSAGAQGRSRGDKAKHSQGIPPGHLPPSGECRVWFDGRPPGQQSSPTSCANARARAARDGGRVIYGDGARRDGRRRDDAVGRDDDDRRYDDGGRDDDDRRRDDDDHREDGRRRDDRRAPDRVYPQTLPEMVWGVVFGRGERQSEVRQWVGGTPMRATITDVDGDGRPEAVTWTDAAGRMVQRWTDADRDGKADRVTLYRDSKVVRVIR